MSHPKLWVSRVSVQPANLMGPVNADGKSLGIPQLPWEVSSDPWVLGGFWNLQISWNWV